MAGAITQLRLLADVRLGLGPSEGAWDASDSIKRANCFVGIVFIVFLSITGGGKVA